MSYRNWLPTTQQMSDALQLRREAFQEVTMQQALGMILAVGWLTGLLPFMADWVRATRIGTALPLADLVRDGMGLGRMMNPAAMAPIRGEMAVFADFFAQLAGMEQFFPGWLAAGLSALGHWVSLPLGWLQIWLVFGLLVMVACRSLGATLTLQHFFGATGYFVVPLLLTSLAIVPYVGWLFRLVALVWAALIYLRAVEASTGLDRMRSVISLLIPLAVLIVLIMLITGLASFIFSILLIR